MTICNLLPSSGLPVGIVEGIESMFTGRLCRGDVGDHAGTRVAHERIPQDVS